MTRLRTGGFDVWIISASMQATVEVMAKLVGITADHVIGTRQMLDPQGLLLPVLKGCGPFPDGNLELMPFRKGKRCWLNEVVFGESDPARFLEKPMPSCFCGRGYGIGSFLFDGCTGLRLAINRNRPELMCHAYHNADGKWLVNPMFIDPMPRKEDGFQCQAFGLPNQKDEVFLNS